MATDLPLSLMFSPTKIFHYTLNISSNKDKDIQILDDYLKCNNLAGVIQFIYLIVKTVTLFCFNRLSLLSRYLVGWCALYAWLLQGQATYKLLAYGGKGPIWKLLASNNLVYYKATTSTKTQWNYNFSTLLKV